MSQENKVSIAIPPATLADAMDYFKKGKDLLQSYLQGLSVEDRKELVKMNDKTIPFVQKTQTHCLNNPEFCPLFLDVTEMGKDLQAVQNLKPLVDIVSGLHSDLEDTMMLCGSEAYLGARYYYNSVSFAAKQGNLSAKPIAEDLGKRFVKGNKKGRDENS